MDQDGLWRTEENVIRINGVLSIIVELITKCTNHKLAHKRAVLAF